MMEAADCSEMLGPIYQTWHRNLINMMFFEKSNSGAGSKQQFSSKYLELHCPNLRVFLHVNDTDFNDLSELSCCFST
jgi:hypothetical protein